MIAFQRKFKINVERATTIVTNVQYNCVVLKPNMLR